MWQCGPRCAPTSAAKATQSSLRHILSACVMRAHALITPLSVHCIVRICPACLSWLPPRTPLSYHHLSWIATSLKPISNHNCVVSLMQAWPHSLVPLAGLPSHRLGVSPLNAPGQAAAALWLWRTSHWNKHGQHPPHGAGGSQGLGGQGRALHAAELGASKVGHIVNRVFSSAILVIIVECF